MQHTIPLYLLFGRIPTHSLAPRTCQDSSPNTEMSTLRIPCLPRTLERVRHKISSSSDQDRPLPSCRSSNIDRLEDHLHDTQRTLHPAPFIYNTRKTWSWWRNSGSVLIKKVYCAFWYVFSLTLSFNSTSSRQSCLLISWLTPLQVGEVGLKFCPNQPPISS